MSGPVVTVSYSELATARRCPLLHELQYNQRWTKEAAPDSPRGLGTLWHAVLAAHYRAIKEFKDEYPKLGAHPEVMLKTAREAVAPLLVDDHSTQTPEQALIEWVYDGYLEHYGRDPGWQVVAVEHRFVVPLLNEQGRKTRFRLKGFIDAVLRDRATGALWLWDHKLVGNQFPSEGDLELDDQFGLYTWAMRQLGKPVMGSLHNAARRERLKTRELTLEERFRRSRVYRNETELTNLAIDAYRTARQAHSAQWRAALFSNPNRFNCRGCDFRQLHLEARRGADIQRLLPESGFTQQMGRH